MYSKMARMVTTLPHLRIDIRRVRLWWLPFVAIGIVILFSSYLNGDTEQSERDLFESKALDDSELDDIVDEEPVFVDIKSKQTNRLVQRNVPKMDKHLINDWMVELKASQDGCLQVERANRSDLPMCSNSLFRLYYSSKHMFPECGKWYSEAYHLTTSYDLDFCLWQPYHMPQCFAEKNIKSILFVGDDSAIKLLVSLLNITQAMGGVCSVVNIEGEKSCEYHHNPAYYAEILGDPNLYYAFHSHPRSCCYCRPQKYRCLLNYNQGPFQIDLEYLPSASFVDRSLSIPEDRAIKYNLHPASNMQEFIYKTYLPKTGYPDIIINELPMRAQKNVPWDVTETRLREWIHLINQQKPKETEVYWVTGAGECEKATLRLSKRYQLRYRYKNLVHPYEDSMSDSEWIYTLNTRIYHILEPFLLNRDLNMHGFINLANMSSTRCDWSYNGQYFQNVWYHKILWQLFSLICAELE